jgi:pyruvate/2-oxoglutarate/acetoin dehydrogenase E1 component
MVLGLPFTFEVHAESLHPNTVTVPVNVPTPSDAPDIGVMLIVAVGDSNPVLTVTPAIGEVGPLL